MSKNGLKVFFKILKRTINFSNKLRKIQIPAIFISGLFVFLFIFIFQPYGLDNFETNNNILLIAAGYGLIVFTVLTISYIIIPLIWKSFFKYNFWNIGLHIAFLIFNLAIIAIINIFYDKLTGFYELKSSFFLNILHTFSIGLFPIIIVIAIIDRVILKTKQSEKIASQITIEDSGNPSTQDTINKPIIILDNKEEIIFYEKELLCFQANDNYVNIYFLKNNIVKKKMVRITLSEIEKQIKKHPKITRCHRSYIVNLDKISELKGTKQKKVFRIKAVNFLIPVSRSFSKFILEKLETKLK